MRTYEESLRSTQASLVIEGVQEAVTLGLKDGAPRLRAVVVVYDAENENGDRTRGLMSFDDLGESLSDDATIAMLSTGGTALSVQSMWSAGHDVPGSDDDGS